MKKNTLYDILQISNAASSDEIAEAFQRQRERLSCAGDHDSQSEWRLVQQAFEVLSDSRQRTRYDQSLYPQAASVAATGGQHGEMAGTSSGAGLKVLLAAAIAVAGYMAYQKFDQGSNAKAASVPAPVLPPVEPAPAGGSPSAESRVAPPSEAPSIPEASAPEPAAPQAAAEQPTALGETVGGWQGTGFAQVDDVAAVPYLTEGGRARYREFLAQPSPRAFIICPDGRFSTIKASTSKALEKSIANRMPTCEPYFINDVVVWRNR